MMSFQRPALAAILLTCLAGCATSDPVAQAPSTAVLAQASSEPAPEPLDLGSERTTSGLFMAGATAIREGRAQDAARFFERAAEIAPDEDKAYLREQTFTAAVMGGDIERAARMAPAAADADAYRLGRLVVAVDKLARGDGKAAVDVITGENLGSYRAAADLVRPWAALAAGDKAAAIGQRVSVDNPQQAFAAINQAQVLEAAGQPQEAGAIYAAMATRGASVAVFVLAHGAYLERQGLRREAVARYDAFLAVDPRDRDVVQARARAASRRAAPPPLPTAQEGAAQALLLATIVSLAQRDVETGVSYLRLSLRLDPDNAKSLIMVGDYLSEAGDDAGARAAYERVPRNSPDYMPSQARVIASYQNAGDAEAALRQAQSFAQANPRDPGVQVLLADNLRTAKDYAGSARVLTKVIDQRGAAAEWNLYYARAVSRHLANDWPGAEKDLLQARALSPDQPDVLNYLGYSWADRGERLDEAMALLQKAAAKTPNSGAVLDSLGWAYFKVGDHQKAVENLERAVELEPAAADINDHLGDVYAAVGRTLEARFQWQRVLTLDADNALKAKVQAKIDAMPEPPPIVAASLAPAAAAP